MVILDATAGNRFMWRHCDGAPPEVVFIDREMKLAVPPDVFADNRFCPFRDSVFECVIYDPPYYVRTGAESKFVNPDLSKKSKGSYFNKPWTHYGRYESKRELVTNLYMAAREFYRISERLCFKWCEGDYSLWRVLPLFKPWKEINRLEHKSKGHYKKSRRYWITFIRSSLSMANDIE